MEIVNGAKGSNEGGEEAPLNLRLVNRFETVTTTVTLDDDGRAQSIRTLCRKFSHIPTVQ